MEIAALPSDELPERNTNREETKIPYIFFLLPQKVKKTTEKVRQNKSNTAFAYRFTSTMNHEDVLKKTKDPPKSSNRHG